MSDVKNAETESVERSREILDEAMDRIHDLGCFVYYDRLASRRFGRMILTIQQYQKSKRKD